MEKNGGMLASKPSFIPAEKLATIPTLFDQAAQNYAQDPCMGTRTIEKCKVEGKKLLWYKGDYAWKTYKEVHTEVQNVAKGLLGLDQVMKLRQQGGDKCVAGILADTSADWQLAAQAAFQVGIPITTVYTTLGHKAMVHGLTETECSVLFLDWAMYPVIEKTVLAECKSLKHIVLIGKCFVPETTEPAESKSIEPFPSDLASMSRAHDAKLTTIDELIVKGKESEIEIDKFTPAEDSLAFIMYTSGSTGDPKGVMLSHKNFVATVAGFEAQGVLKPTKSDTYIAYLPLAHILELLCETASLVAGGKIGYGSPKTLTAASPFSPKDKPDNADLITLRPSLMVAVPAILDLIKNGLAKKVADMDGFKGKLVRGTINLAEGRGSGEGLRTSFLLNAGVKHVLKRAMRKQLGLENLRIIGSGGAPLSPETQSFITDLLAPVAQGYGATETTGASTIQEVYGHGGRNEDRSCGSVGPVQPSCELKLRSVPDMGYLITDNPPRGEILLGGNSVSQLGYFKMFQKTEEDFPRHDSDGQRWFHTGDIGVMNPNGTLKIIDRKKDLIKLSGGEYVSLGKVEAELKQVTGIGACVVFAQSEKDHCVCIVSQPEKGWGSIGGKPDEAALTKAIEQKLRAEKFARFEIPTKVRVDDHMWTPENGLMTASFKVQRNPLRKHYNESGGLLDQMHYRFAE
jgi:long-chain acyl-CoA synthetase